MLVLVDTENTSDQFITRLAVDMVIYRDLHGWISSRIYGLVDIHLKVEHL